MSRGIKSVILKVSVSAYFRMQFPIFDDDVVSTDEGRNTLNLGGETALSLLVFLVLVSGRISRRQKNIPRKVRNEYTRKL